MNGNTITVYRMKTRDIVPYIYIDRPIVAKSPWTIGPPQESRPDRLPCLLDESPSSQRLDRELPSPRSCGAARERRASGGGDGSSLSPLLFLEGRSSWRATLDQPVLADALADDDDARGGDRATTDLDEALSDATSRDGDDVRVGAAFPARRERAGVGRGTTSGPSVVGHASGTTRPGTPRRTDDWKMRCACNSAKR